MISRMFLLTGTALFAWPAFAQTSPPAPSPASPPSTIIPQSAPDASSVPVEIVVPDGDEAGLDEFDDGGDAIVITGQRARGSVVGDIPPEETLDSRDVRATGATNINELLEALAPQIGSAQGRGGERPVILLDGKRVSGFRELRDLPTEAIERVEILPEEVGLKYGYTANQKVVNIVLRPRFRSTAVNLEGSAATEGGQVGGEADVTRLMINRGGRTTVNLHAEGNSMLTEDERDIQIVIPTSGANPDDVLAARSLIGARQLYRGGVTLNRSISDAVSGTFNAEAEHSEGRSLIGLGEILLDPLGRRTSGTTGHLGFIFNGSKSDWQWSLTGNGDVEARRTKTDRDDLFFPVDRARDDRLSADLTATAHGTLFKLPAGDAGATFTLGGETVRLDSERRRQDIEQDSRLSRSAGRAAVSVDLPISRRNRDFSALGNFTLNANAELNRLSDFGTLTSIGAGANFSPVDRLNFLASWSREEGAPTINQLGDAVIETPDTRIFDFTTGETVEVTAITGGNPGLAADRRTVWKLGANWQPIEDKDLRLRGEYVTSRIDRPIRSIFGPTAALEAAFPDRFERDDSGQLTRVDLRPINFDEARRDTIRIGLDFTKPLKSRRPSQSVMDRLRAEFRGGRRGVESRPGEGPTAASPAPASPNETGTTPGVPSQGSGDAPPPPPPPEADRAPRGDRPSGGFGFGRGGRGGGGLFGGGSRGRLTFSITDTITLKDEVRIGPGAPVLDYLGGEANGAGGGTPRHRIEARAGWSNNGLGARLSADWQSATEVRTQVGDELRFSPLATIDLRLFANLGEQPALVLAHPWLRGTSLRFEIDNVFDAKPKVRDSSGGVPLSYQSDLLNPLGRTVSFSIRKLFLPSRASMRREFERERPGDR